MGKSLCIYLPHVKSLASTMRPGTLYREGHDHQTNMATTLHIQSQCPYNVWLTCAKSQLTTASISHHIAIYEEETKMATNLHIQAIYTKYLKCMYGDVYTYAYMWHK